MKSFAITAISILITNLLFAQTSKVGGNNDFYLSDNPTANELTEIFRSTTAGTLDPFLVIEKVAEKDNKALKALEEFLFTAPKMKTKSSGDSALFSPAEVEPNKLYAVHALDVIGTPEATQVMINAALTHFDIEVRGAAIRSLAFFSYYKAREDDKTPDKEILHVLMKSADDLTYVESLGEKTGKIAREGVKNWTGLDFGDLPDEKLSAEINKNIDMKKYREEWWQKNSSKLSWNKDTKLFEIKN